MSIRAGVLLICFWSIQLIAFTQPVKSSIDSLRHHIYYLASNELKGRATGEEGQKLAATFIKKRFEAYGLSPLSQNYYNHDYSIVRKNKNFMVVKSQGNLVFWPWHFYFVSSIHGKDTLKAPLIFTGYGSDEEIKPLITQKKAIAFIAYNPKDAYQTATRIHKTYGNQIFFAMFPNNNPLVEKTWGIEYQLTEFNLPNDFQRIGAEPITEEWIHPVSTDTLQLYYCFPNVLRNLFMLTDSELERIAKENLKKKENSLSYIIQPELKCITHYSDSLEKIAVENVGGFIKGYDTTRTIIISAHFDHIGEELGKINYGADDNASGTAALLEVARLSAEQSKRGNKPACNLLFLAFSGEELGLLGSKAFVQNPVLPLNQIIFNINLDMIGRWDERHEFKKDFVYLLTAGKNHKKLYSLGNKKLQLPEGFLVSNNPGPKEKIAFRYGSDHHSFFSKDIPVAFFFTGLHNDYHTPGDIPEKINYPNLTTITDMVFQYVQKAAQENIKLFPPKKPDSKTSN